MILRSHSLLLLSLCSSCSAWWWRDGWGDDERGCQQQTVRITETVTETRTRTAQCLNFGTSSAPNAHSSATSLSTFSSAHSPTSSYHTFSQSTSHGTPSTSHGTQTTSHGTQSASHGTQSASHGTQSTSHGTQSTSHGTQSITSHPTSVSTILSSSLSSLVTSSPAASTITVSSQSSSALSSSSTASSAGSTATPFLILANSPTSPSTDQNYALLASDGSLTFTTNDPTSATSFTLSSAGNLLANGLYAQVSAPTNGVSEVQFLSPLTKRQAAGGTPLICTVTASDIGAPLLSCSADSSTAEQVCGQSFYLGATDVCQPLILATYDPATATTSGGSGAGTPGTPSASFELQYNTATATNGYYALYYTSGGNTELAFAGYGHGATFSLDGSGHLLSVGPTASGAVVTYAAVFEVGSTFGPVIEQTGTVPAGYVAIVCTMDGTTNILSCTDGATGANMVLQVCDSDILYLGTALGSGCTIPVLTTVATS